MKVALTYRIDRLDLVYVYLSLRFKGHFSGEPGLADVYNNWSGLISRFLSSKCTEVSGVENIDQCGRLSQLSWHLGALKYSLLTYLLTKDDGCGYDNWTTGAISRAKLQSNHHHQQTNIHFFYRPDALPVAVTFRFY